MGDFWGWVVFEVVGDLGVEDTKDVMGKFGSLHEGQKRV
jgi:hypothetical protein